MFFAITAKNRIKKSTTKISIFSSKD